MKSLSEVIDALGSLADPSRYIDYQIANLIGWKQIRDGDIAAGAVRNEVVWLHPLSEEPARVPKFTLWVQSAYNLVQQFEPDRAGAVTKQPHGSQVQIEGYEKVVAATLPIALCLAAMKIMHTNQNAA